MRRFQHPGMLGAAFPLALATLLLLGWAGWVQLHLPYPGAQWSPYTGVVDFVDPTSPAAGRLAPDDRILTVDGVPLRNMLPLSARHRGETLHLVVERAGVVVPVLLRLTSSPLSVLLQEVLPLVVALAFWVLSVAVLLFVPNGPTKWLMLLFGQILSATLASGSLSWGGPRWVLLLFHVLVWWFGPVAMVFHFHFPVRASSYLLRRVTPLLLLGAGVGSVLDLAGHQVLLRAQFPLVSALQLLWLGSCLLGVLVTLVWTYRYPPSGDVRHHAGLILLGGSIAFLPFLTLSLLPDTLLSQPLLPYEGSFLFFLLVPLTYGYAIFRYRLLPLERYVNRGFATLLVGTVLGGGYLIVYAGLLDLLSPSIWQQPVLPLLLGLMVGVTVLPAHAGRC